MMLGRSLITTYNCVRYRTPTVHYRTLLFLTAFDYETVTIVARALHITYQASLLCL